MIGVYESIRLRVIYKQGTFNQCDTMFGMTYESNSIFWVEVEKIVPNPFQPRREFNQKKLQELGESIRMYGMLQPLIVTRREIIGDSGAFKTEYELIAGERRLRASKLVGLEQVPVIIRSGEENEHMKLELAIIENLQREDLNAIDRALAFKQLADSFELSHSQIARKMGKSREYVSNSIRLLQLPDTILNALRSEDIADGHARTLLMLNDRPEEQDVLFRETMLKKLSVREVEKLARKVAVDKVRKKNWDVDPEIIEIEKQFTESLGTRVQISKTDYGGRLTIDYFSQEDLAKLFVIINGQNKEDQKLDNENSVISHIIKATPLETVVGENFTDNIENNDENTKAPDVVDEPAPEVATVELPDNDVVENFETNVEEGANLSPHEDYTGHDTLYVESQIEEIPEEDKREGTVCQQVSDESIADAPQTISNVNATHQNTHVATKEESVVPEHNQSNNVVNQKPQINEEPETQVKKDEEDTALYSIKNFSL